MSATLCLRCLARSLPSRSSPFPPFLSTTAFSTSTPSLRIDVNAAKSKTRAIGGVRKGGRGVKMTYQVKKKSFQREDRSRKPAPGERKAMRKRIVLSNTNALEVVGMEELDETALTRLRDLHGRTLALKGETIDQLRAAEAFKATQNWALFRRAGTLIRNETLEMNDIIEATEKNKTVQRKIVVGERSSGKSLLALQAMAMGFLRGWTIINIPEAQDLVLGSTAYAPLADTKLYLQKTYVASLLSKMARSNTHLANIALSSQPSTRDFPIPLQENISLGRLAEMGAADPEIAHQVFMLLIQELTLADQGRPPVLICLDGLAHAFTPQTAYHDQKNKPIHALDLWMLDWFMKCLTNQISLPNGGLVLATTSDSNSPHNRTLDFALTQLHQAPSTSLQPPSSPITSNNTHTSLPDAVRHNPFFPYDTRVLSIFQTAGLRLQEVHGLSKLEAARLMEYWAKSGIMSHRVDAAFIGEKWTMSGGGMVGELERCCLRMRI